jgi:3-dehydroquinate synthase
MERAINVELGTRSYRVRIGAGALGSLGAAVAGLGGATAAAVVSDDRVAALYARRAIDSLAASGVRAGLITFPAGEASKTLATASGVLDALFAQRPAVDRSAVVVALGGGVTGDLAGFVAAVALRGLRFFQCPTTLLADVDSSVGGKTGVDHPAGKNLIGAFHQPSGVLIDVAALPTLPPAELRGGLAECVKHGVIRDEALLDFIERNAGAILACDADVMTELVARNVAIKAAVVSADERESGQRAHLNFGHTIGHAIETLAGYGSVTHGQAVSLGMVAAMHLAVRRGLLGQCEADRVERLLGALGLPLRRAGLDFAALLPIMRHDKKARAGQVRMVLPSRLGAVDVHDDVTTDELSAAAGYLAG